MHLNAIPTDHRLQFVQGVDGQHGCYLCGRGVDSQSHIFTECQFVKDLKVRLCEHGRDIRDVFYAQHTLATPAHWSLTGDIVKFNDVVIRLRSLCRRYCFNSTSDAIRHGLLLFQHQGLRGGEQKSERTSRNREPHTDSRPGFTYYQTHGTLCRQNAGRSRAAWRVVSFESLDNGQRSSQVWRSAEYLGEGITGSVAAYRAVLASMVRALELERQHICIQASSTLIAQQLACKWACQAESLQPLLTRVWAKNEPWSPWELL